LDVGDQPATHAGLAKAVLGPGPALPRGPPIRALLEDAGARVLAALDSVRMDVRTYSAEERLRDGTRVWLRAVRHEDQPAFREGFARLSERSIYHRFFQAKAGLTDVELSYLTAVDFRDHVALVAEVEAPGGAREGVGVGRFVRLRNPGAADHAEVAFTVEDRHQGRGVGTLLLDHLARIARDLGYRAFEAEVLPDNRQMMEVFEHSGLGMRQDLRDGVLHVVLDL
jgi:GNAT superfamily N-acetyltransferase